MAERMNFKLTYRLNVIATENGLLISRNHYRGPQSDMLGASLVTGVSLIGKATEDVP